MIIQYHSLPKNLLGRYQPETDVIILSNNLTKGQKDYAIVHELTHKVGFNNKLIKNLNTINGCKIEECIADYVTSIITKTTYINRFIYIWDEYKDYIICEGLKRIPEVKKLYNKIKEL